MMITGDLEAIAAHMLWCRRRNLAESTIYQRNRVLERTRKLLRERPPLAELGLTLMTATTDALEETLERRWQAAARACEVSHLRGFYRWAAWAGARGDDPSIDLVRPQVPRGLPRPIQDEVLDRALALAPPRIRTILMLAAWAGLRAKEIAPLRVEHVMVDLSPAMLFIASAKGGDNQAVPLHPVLVDELRHAMPAAGWLFPRLDGAPGPWRPWSVSGTTNTFLHDVVGTPKTLHSLRHWYGTGVLRSSGGNVRVAQQALRHRSVVSTSIYTWIHPGDVAEAIDGLPGPGQMRAAA